MNTLAQVPMKLLPFNETAAGRNITRSRGYINTNSTSVHAYKVKRIYLVRIKYAVNSHVCFVFRFSNQPKCFNFVYFITEFGDI